MSPRATLLLLSCVALVAAACGNEPDPSAPQSANPEKPQMAVVGPESLPASDLADVARAEETINAACGQAQPGKAPTMSLRQAVATIARVAAENPQARYAQGESTRIRNMRTVAADAGAILRKCGHPAAAARLARLARH